MCIDVFKKPATFIVLSYGTCQSSAVGGNPHGTLCIAIKTDNVVRQKDVLRMLLRVFELLNGQLIVLIRKNQYAIRCACPDISVAINCDGTYFLIGIDRVVLHAFLGAEEIVLAFWS